MRRRSSVALPNFGSRRRDSNASNSSPSAAAQLKDEIVKDIFHVGLVNLGNSCFYNTIVQALSSTQPLTDIINEAPSSSPALQALSPTSPNYNPDLEALPSPLPMTAALLVLLDKLDPTKEGAEGGGGGTPMGKKAFNPKSLLRQLSLKHDEYAEATQQDSHELLRHLIDGVMMEEQDLIKKLSALPPPHPHAHASSNPRRPSLHARGATVKALNETVIASGDAAVVPEDALSDSSASVHEGDSADEEDEGEGEESESSSSEEEESSSEEESEEEEQRKKGKGAKGKKVMRPFVGSVFEGKLSSFIICDECKNVSQTKEDFMDISLSLRDDTGNRMRKRDRIRRTLQAGFFSRKSNRSGSGSNKESGGEEVKQAPNGVLGRRHNSSSRTSLSQSETEGSATEASETADETDEDHIRPAHLAPIANGRSRHESLDPSSKEKDSLAPPPEASTRSNSIPGSLASRDPSPLGRALSVLSRGSGNGSGDGGGGGGHQHHHHFHRSRPKIPKPTKEQIAFIKQVLVDVPGPDAASPTLPPGLRVARPPGSAPSPTLPPTSSTSSSPDISSTTTSLSKLRLQPAVDWQNTDLFECFRQFTAVEVLEGENSFACRQCWKYLNPELEARRKEDRERRRAERKLRRAARAQSRSIVMRSGVNGSVTAAVEVDGDGRVLRPGDVARKELKAREAQANELAASANGVEEEQENALDSDDDDYVKDGDLTARNTPAASPRAMPTISTITPESSIPPIEPLSPSPSSSSAVVTSPTSVLTPTPPAAAPRRHFSISSAATTDSSAAATDADYDGGVSSEAFETTTDEEDNDDSPELDGRSLSGSVVVQQDEFTAASASLGPKMPLTVDNVAALPTTNGALSNGVPNGGGLAVPSPAAGAAAKGAQHRPSTAASNTSAARSFLSSASKSRNNDTTTLPPKAQRQILRRAHKRYLISPSDLPPVLVVHLKRFMQTSKSSLFGSAFVNLKKRDDPVSFPKEMDLSPFLAPEGRAPKVNRVQLGEAQGEREGLGVRGLEKGMVPEEAVELEKEVAHARYRLYALVVHFGSIDSGHYSSYVLTSRYGKGAEAGKGERRWVFCSDEEIMAVSENEVMRSKPYMLFYERVPSSSSSTSTAAIPAATNGSSSPAVFDSPKPSPSPAAALQPPPTVPEEAVPKLPSPVVEKPVEEGTV